jgi:hypothetical protein
MALKEERLAPTGGVWISTECYVDEKRLAISQDYPAGHLERCSMS